MKSLGTCFAGDATIGAGTADTLDDDDDEKLAPGGGAILNDPKSLCAAAGTGAVGAFADPLEPPKSPKSPNPSAPLLLLLLGALSKLPKSANPAEALAVDDSLPNAEKSPNCANPAPLADEAAELSPNASNVGAAAALADGAKKSSSADAAKEDLLRELPDAALRASSFLLSARGDSYTHLRTHSHHTHIEAQFRENTAAAVVVSSSNRLQLSCSHALAVDVGQPDEVARALAVRAAVRAEARVVLGSPILLRRL